MSRMKERELEFWAIKIF